MRKNTKEQMVMLLLEGRDIQHYPYAEPYLNELLDYLPQRAWKLALPIARRLMAYYKWHTIPIAELCDYCMLREDVLKLLYPYQSENGVDEHTEYMLGMVESIREKYNLGSSHHRDANGRFSGK